MYYDATRSFDQLASLCSCNQVLSNLALDLFEAVLRLDILAIIHEVEYNTAQSHTALSHLETIS